ncbi:hypothetical protein ABEY65_27615 [Priestia aryabhattai]|uniref:hypothetical protein n=1 Tax=Priestia aryabhattai TaxID=412384 RepID=UPI003D2DDDB1
MNTKRVCIYLPLETLRLTDTVKSLTGLSRGKVLKLAIDDFLKNKGIEDLKKLGERND